MALEFVAGCLGGCAGVAVGHPLDTIKVKLQTQDAFNPKYKGTWHCLTETVKTESIRGLYKGMTSPLVGVSFVNAVVFGIHGNIMKNVSNPNAISSHALAGACAGVVQSFIVSPMELAKTRIQIQSDRPGPQLYKGPLDCAKKIFRIEGVRGIFKGQGVTIMREVPGFATYFASYEYLTQKLTVDGELSTGAILGAGGCAGMLSWLSNYPIDVVKSRIQADGMDGKNQYNGFIDCIKKSVSNEGYSVLTRGLASTLIRSFPANAATFAVVSQVMKLGEEEFNPDSDTWKDILNRGEIILSSVKKPFVDAFMSNTYNVTAMSSVFLDEVSAHERRSEEMLRRWEITEYCLD